MPGPTDALGYSPGSPFYHAPSGGGGGFNINPAPQQGNGPFGMVPGMLDLPNPAQDLGAQYGNLSGTNAGISDTILAQLGGRISPGTTNALRTASAQGGVGSGMPGAGLWTNNLFANIAGFAENQANRGIQNYANIIPTISHTQTVSPDLQTQIALQNAVNRAAPNPQQAQSYAQSLFNNYRNSIGGGGQVSGLGGGGGAAFVRQPWASQVGNPAPMGGVGRLGGSGFGFGSGTNTGAGAGWGGFGGMDEYNWIADQGFDPASYGVAAPGSRATFYAGEAAPGAFQGYDQPIGPSAGYDYAIGPDQGTGGGGGNDIQSYIDEYGL